MNPRQSFITSFIGWQSRSSHTVWEREIRRIHIPNGAHLDLRMDPPGSHGSINLSSDSPGKILMQSPTESLRGRRSGGAMLGRARTTWSNLMKGTIFSSIFTLLTTCIGAGTLSLPYAFDQVRREAALKLLSFSVHLQCIGLVPVECQSDYA